MPHQSGESDTDETVPASADTFLLYLDPSGTVVANPSRVTLTGLPDLAAHRLRMRPVRICGRPRLTVRMCAC